MKKEKMSILKKCGIVAGIVLILLIILGFVIENLPHSDEHELKENQYKIISQSQKLTYKEDGKEITKKYDNYYGEGTPTFSTILDYEYFFDYDKERTFNVGIIGELKSKNTSVLSAKNVTPIKEDIYLVNKGNETDDSILISKIRDYSKEYEYDFNFISAYITDKKTNNTSFYIGLEDNKVKIWAVEEGVKVTLKLETTSKEDLGKYVEYNLTLTTNPIYISINEEQKFVKVENGETEVKPKQYRVEFKYDYQDTRYVNPGETLEEPDKYFTDEYGYLYTQAEDWYDSDTKEKWNFKKDKVNKNLTLRANYDSKYVGKDR